MAFDDNERYFFKIKYCRQIKIFKLTMVKNDKLIEEFYFDDPSELSQKLAENCNPSVSNFLNLILNHAGFRLLKL